MPPKAQKSAESFTIGDQVFIVHSFSSSQSLDVLLMLGEVIAPALGKLLNRKVSSDLSDIAEAVDELKGMDVDMALPSLLAVFGTVRKIGGIDLVVSILQTTYHEDRPINTRARFDEVFQGPGALVDAARVLWHVLRFQLSPLWDALRPLLSGRGGDKVPTPKS